MNLLSDPWIPVRRQSGSRELIAPWNITAGLDNDPVVALASPRGDCDSVIAELLVGLLQATLAPASDTGWRARLKSPPAPEELRDVFTPLADAFELLGDGPRFLQDLTLLEEQPNHVPVEKLLPEAGLTGGQAHFWKTGTVEQLCPCCSAAVLLTLQINGPGGGRGHRTGLRGAGPISTLAWSDEAVWTALWLNVLPASLLEGLAGNPERTARADRFPWLAPTRTSADGRGLTADEVHPLHLYWPMPRRFRLIDEEVSEPARCDLCTVPTRTLIRQVATLSHGINYQGSWTHPFSPWTVLRDGTRVSVRPTPTGLSYEDWLGVVMVDEARNRHPAPVVHELRRRARPDDPRWEVWASGYAFDNMRVRCWVDGRIKVVLPDPGQAEDFEDDARSLVLAARHAAESLRRAVRQAIRRREKDARADASFVEDVAARFWQQTEAPFYDHLSMLANLSADDDTAVDAVKRRWHRELTQTAECHFRDITGAGQIEAGDAARIVSAWKWLRKNLQGKTMKDHLGLAELTEPPVTAADSATEGRT